MNSANIISNTQADLLTAVQEDDLGLLCIPLAAKDVDVNYIYKYPVLDSCVHLAAKSDRTELLEVLLRSGADPNLWNPYKKITPLMCAVQKLNLESVILLLKHGASPNMKQDQGRTALHLLVVHSARNPVSSDEALAIGVELLKNSECDIDARDNAIYTPLRIAVEGRQDDLARLLVSNGAETNLPCEGDKGQCIADVLKSRQIEQDPSLKLDVARHKNLANLLYEALLDRDIAKFRTHLKRVSTNTELLDVMHGTTTCLGYASYNNLVEFVEALLSAGANPTVCDTHNKVLPIHHAAWKGNLSVLKLLLKVAPNSVNAEDMNKQTVLHKIISGAEHCLKKDSNHLACLLYLTSRVNKLNINVGHIDNVGFTALDHLVEN